MRETSGTRMGSLAILALAVSTLLAPASRSATPDTSEWKCESCPFAKGHVAEATVGSSYVSDDAATFGDASGYDTKGGYLEVDGHGLQATATHRLGWRVEDLGVDSRVVEIDGAHSGTFDYRLSYRQLPRHRFDTTRTIFTHTSGNLLALPQAWTVAGTTAGLSDLAASLVSQDIESERQTLALGGGYRPTSRFRLFADFERQENDGTNVQGAPYFTHASLLPRYFDYRTDQVDAGLRYDGERGYLKLAYYGSFFDNRFDALRWQSPFTTAPGAGQGALAEAPDNDFQQLVLTGSYRAALFDTHISFSAAMGRGQQDEDLLPYTTNPNLVTAALPVSALDGEVDTTNLALTVTARPLPKTRIKLAVRADERDNQTPSLTWSRVIADTFPSGAFEMNQPYGYERLRMNLSADYAWSDTLGFSAGYDFTDLDRDFQEVAEQNEDTGWGRVQWRPNPYLDISARGGIARREIDDYDEAVAIALAQNPLLRKYNLAYRYREFGELSLSATLPELPVTIGAQASWADDSYSSSPLGLTDSEELRLAVDLGWSVSDQTFVYLTGGYDQVESLQAGSGAFAAPDWFADYSDEFFSLGGGFRITGIGEKVDLELDYTRAVGTTDIRVTGGSGPPQFPDLESALDSLRVHLLYHWSERLEARILLRYENLPTEDWALEGVEPDTLPTVLSLGARPYDDEVWMIGIGFRYLLGER